MDLLTSAELLSLRDARSSLGTVDLKKLSFLVTSLAVQMQAFNSGKATNNIAFIDKVLQPNDTITFVNVVPNENVNLYERVDLSLCPINCHNNNGECRLNPLTNATFCFCKPALAGEGCNIALDYYAQLQNLTLELVDHLASNTQNDLASNRLKIAICSSAAEMALNTFESLLSLSQVLNSTLPSVNSATAASQAAGALSNINDMLIRKYTELLDEEGLDAFPSEG